MGKNKACERRGRPLTGKDLAKQVYHMTGKDLASMTYQYEWILKEIRSGKRLPDRWPEEEEVETEEEEQH